MSNFSFFIRELIKLNLIKLEVHNVMYRKKKPKKSIHTYFLFRNQYSIPQTTKILINNHQTSFKSNDTKKFQIKKNLKTTLFLNNIFM